MTCGCNHTSSLYSFQENTTDNLKPRIRPYSGWASYKNNKSGNFHRSLCWTCSQATGFPQTAGLYPLNIDNTPVANHSPTPDTIQQLQTRYDSYQQHRLSNHGGQWNGYYVNYLNDQCGNSYPRRYVKGFWPDEQKQVTNTSVNGIDVSAQEYIPMTYSNKIN